MSRLDYSPFSTVSAIFLKAIVLFGTGIALGQGPTVVVDTYQVEVPSDIAGDPSRVFDVAGIVTSGYRIHVSDDRPVVEAVALIDRTEFEGRLLPYLQHLESVGRFSSPLDAETLEALDAVEPLLRELGPESPRTLEVLRAQISRIPPGDSFLRSRRLLHNYWNASDADRALILEGIALWRDPYEADSYSSMQSLHANPVIVEEAIRYGRLNWFVQERLSNYLASPMTARELAEHVCASEDPPIRRFRFGDRTYEPGALAADTTCTDVTMDLLASFVQMRLDELSVIGRAHSSDPELDFRLRAYAQESRGWLTDLLPEDLATSITLAAMNTDLRQVPNIKAGHIGIAPYPGGVLADFLHEPIPSALRQQLNSDPASTPSP